MLTPLSTLINPAAYLWQRWQRKGLRPGQARLSTIIRHMRKASA